MCGADQGSLCRWRGCRPCRSALRRSSRDVGEILVDMLFVQRKSCNLEAGGKLGNADAGEEHRAAVGDLNELFKVAVPDPADVGAVGWAGR